MFDRLDTAQRQPPETILAFRRFNRFYTRLLGLFNRKLLDGPLTLAEARTLHEIVATPGISAAAISRTLGMDRSQLSRILSKLLKDGLIERHGEPSGRKQLPIHPTDAGLTLLSELEAASNQQAGGLLAPLDERQRARLRTALCEVERLLGGETETDSHDLTIREAEPGDLGWIVTRHAEYYSSEHGFNKDFEKYVLLSMAEFAQKDPDGSRVWIAEHAGAVVGSVGVVELEGKRAQLRWLFVEPCARGLGVGKQLVRQALAFCKSRGYTDVILWTLSFLRPARLLYASSGFQIIETCECVMGGKTMTEECWALNLLEDNSHPDRDAILSSEGVRHQNGHTD